MNDNKANSLLETERPGMLMQEYAVPCITSLLVAALYNIVNQTFITSASYLGSYGNAANTVVFPLAVVVPALAITIGDGCCASVSLSLGSGQEKNAHRSIGNSVVPRIVTNLILIAIYLLFQEPIITVFGGRVNKKTFVQSKEYSTWISIGVPFYMFGQALNPIIHPDGNPKFIMTSTLADVVVNIIPDPILIFGFHWGVMDAAPAAVLGQALTARSTVWYLCHMKAVRLEHHSFHLSAYLIKRFVPLRLCSFLSQISLVAAIAAINDMTQKYGALGIIFDQPEHGQIPMAAVGIVMRFLQIIISIAVSMVTGCTLTVGYNMSTNRKDRAASPFKILLTAEAVVSAITSLIIERFPRQLIATFGAANESACHTDLAVKTFRIYLCIIILACINKATFIYLQSLGKTLASALLSMACKAVFGADFALLLPVWLGLDGVFYSMPVSDVLTFVMPIAVITYASEILKITPSSGISDSFASAYEPVD